MNPCSSNCCTTNLKLYTETQHGHWGTRCFHGNMQPISQRYLHSYSPLLSPQSTSLVAADATLSQDLNWMYSENKAEMQTPNRWQLFLTCVQRRGPYLPITAAASGTHAALKTSTFSHYKRQWRQFWLRNVHTARSWEGLLCVTQCSRDPDTYLEKLFVVHVLIAINIKHFESYVESCVRLCKGKAMAVAPRLSQCNWSTELENDS